MPAGRKRHRISIQRRTDATNAYGEAVATWSDLVTRYSARVRDDSQREFTANLQVQSDKRIHFEIRDPRQTLTTKDRVIWHAAAGDRTLDINAVLAGENIGRDLVLVCSEHSTEQ